MSPAYDPQSLRALELDVNRHEVVAAQAQEWLERHAASADPLDVRRVELVHAAASARAGHVEDGATRMREIRQWAADHGEAYLQARAERLLGVLFSRAGEGSASLEHAVASIQLLPPDTHPTVLADHLVGLGDALALSGTVDEALAEYTRAEQIARDCHDTDLFLLALNNLTYTLYEVGRFEEAAQQADVLVRVTLEAHGELPLATLDTAGSAYAAVGRLEEAERLFAAVDLTDDVTPEDAAETLLSLARVRRQRGDLDGARAALERAEATCQGQQLGAAEMRALGERSELAAAAGDYRQAFELYKQFHERSVAHRAVEQEARARMMQAIFQTSQARAESERLREMSYRDPLTRLRNRRFVDEQLPQLIDDQLLVGRPLSVAFIDLDYFKRINDTCSHEVGDEVLRRVAAVLDGTAHGVDGAFAARMGGEEFLLALPGLDVQEAARRLESMRHVVERLQWDGLTCNLPVTVSIGAATAPQDGTERLLLLGAADRRLYRAKDAGRNRVVFLEPEPVLPPALNRL